MLKRVSAIKTRRNLGQLLEEVFYRGNEFIIERSGKPMAVVIPLSEYEAYRKQSGQDTKVFDRIKNRASKLGEVTEDI